MLKLIIFDMDGLMFATEQVNYRAFTEIVKEEGYNPTFEQYIGFLGMNAKDIQKKYYVYYGEDVDAEGIYKKVGNRSKQTFFFRNSFFSDYLLVTAPNR